MNLSSKSQVIFSNSNSWEHTKTEASLLYIVDFSSLNVYGSERCIMIHNCQDYLLP